MISSSRTVRYEDRFDFRKILETESDGALVTPPDWNVPGWWYDIGRRLSARSGEDAGEGPTGNRRHIYRSMEWTRLSPQRVRCRVRIRSPRGSFTGLAEGPGAPAQRADIAARATLDALNGAEKSAPAMALEGVRVVRAFDVPIVVVSLYGFDEGSIPLVGACVVCPSVEEATILAVLEAVDRWLTWRAGASDHGRPRSTNGASKSSNGSES